jgi:ElaB/YqjD/DUF883 family membrane-anchored ribosome-binding protein
MSDQHAASAANATPDQRDPESIREEISRTREDMGETLDALSAKLDVKGQANAKVDNAKTEAKAKMDDAMTQAKVKADQAKTQAQALVSEAKEQAQTAYRRQPKAVIIGAGAVVVAIVAGLLVRRARR